MIYEYGINPFWENFNGISVLKFELESSKLKMTGSVFFYLQPAV